MRKVLIILAFVLIQATGWTLYFIFDVKYAIRATNSAHLLLLSILVVFYYEAKIFYDAFDRDMEERRNRKLD